jgi:hypothetical protein
MGLQLMVKRLDLLPERFTARSPSDPERHPRGP